MSPVTKHAPCFFVCLLLFAVTATWGHPCPSVARDSRHPSSATLRTMHYPSSSYNNNVFCRYSLSADPGKHIVVTFADFQTEPGHDVVTFVDPLSRQNPVLTVSGSPDVSGVKIVSIGRRLNISFKTDGSRTYRGYLMRIKFVGACQTAFHECDVMAECSNTDKGYNCTCADGYIGSGRTAACTDANECLIEDVCPPNTTCTNTAGSFTCGGKLSHVTDQHNMSLVITTAIIAATCLLLLLALLFIILWWRQKQLNSRRAAASLTARAAAPPCSVPVLPPHTDLYDIPQVYAPPPPRYTPSPVKPARPAKPDRSHFYEEVILRK